MSENGASRAFVAKSVLLDKSGVRITTHVAGECLVTREFLKDTNTDGYTFVRDLSTALVNRKEHVVISCAHSREAVAISRRVVEYDR